MRHCPTLASDIRPLIAQSIQSDLCMARQRGFYHKCHRCVYSGEAADFAVKAPHLNGVVEVPVGFVSDEEGSEEPVLKVVPIERGAQAPEPKPKPDRVSSPSTG